MSDANSPMSGRRGLGLSAKLIAMIVIAILAVEVIVYLPSAANFRHSWLEDRVQVGAVAARVFDTVPDAMDISPTFANALLVSAGATALVVRHEGQSVLIERTDIPMPRWAQTVDLRETNPLVLIAGALDTLFGPGTRTLRILGSDEAVSNGLVEVLVPEASLRNELFNYSRNIFFLSLVIAAVTSAAIFLFLNRLLIGPIARLTANMVAFRKTPDNGTLIITPGQRGDEIGVAERELAALESDLFAMLRQRKHLADLGLAVAKINHDLRNTLGAAQLLSDQVATLDDPEVQRLAPRLVQTLDRAIGFAQSVLDYGRQASTPPRPQPVDLRALVEESAVDAGLFGHPSVGFENRIDDGNAVSVDPDQLSRVFVNLLRNAREALEGAQTTEALIAVELIKDDGGLSLAIFDNGPGLPPRARENLFRAFEGSGKSGGTGLGLVIARELTEANGARLRFVEVAQGTRFEIDFPGSLRA